MIVLIDNYDSFMFNLARFLQELGEDILVVQSYLQVKIHCLSLSLQSPTPRLKLFYSITNSLGSLTWPQRQQ